MAAMPCTSTGQLQCPWVVMLVVLCVCVIGCCSSSADCLAQWACHWRPRCHMAISVVRLHLACVVCLWAAAHPASAQLMVCVPATCRCNTCGLLHQTGLAHVHEHLDNFLATRQGKAPKCCTAQGRSRKPTVGCTVWHRDVLLCSATYTVWYYLAHGQNAIVGSARHRTGAPVLRGPASADIASLCLERTESAKRALKLLQNFASRSLACHM